MAEDSMEIVVESINSHGIETTDGNAEDYLDIDIDLPHGYSVNEDDMVDDIPPSTGEGDNVRESEIATGPDEFMLDDDNHDLTYETNDELMYEEDLMEEEAPSHSYVNVDDAAFPTFVENDAEASRSPVIEVERFDVASTGVVTPTGISFDTTRMGSPLAPVSVESVRAETPNHAVIGSSSEDDSQPTYNDDQPAAPHTPSEHDSGAEQQDSSSHKEDKLPGTHHSPTYNEEPTQQDLSRDEIGLRQILVMYQSGEYHLFNNGSNDPDQYFIDDLSIAIEPISAVFHHIRNVLSMELCNDEELCLSFREFGLELEETSCSELELTIMQMLQLHERLIENEYPVDTEISFSERPLRIYLATRPMFAERLINLLQGATARKTLAEILSREEEGVVENEASDSVADVSGNEAEFDGEQDQTIEGSFEAAHNEDITSEDDNEKIEKVVHEADDEDHLTEYSLGDQLAEQQKNDGVDSKNTYFVGESGGNTDGDESDEHNDNTFDPSQDILEPQGFTSDVAVENVMAGRSLTNTQTKQSSDVDDLHGGTGQTLEQPSPLSRSVTGDEDHSKDNDDFEDWDEEVEETAHISDVNKLDDGITHFIPPCNLPQNCVCPDCTERILAGYDELNERLKRRSLSRSVGSGLDLNRNSAAEQTPGCLGNEKMLEANARLADDTSETAIVEETSTPNHDLESLSDNVGKDDENESTSKKDTLPVPTEIASSMTSESDKPVVNTEENEILDLETNGLHVDDGELDFGLDDDRQDPTENAHDHSLEAEVIPITWSKAAISETALSQPHADWADHEDSSGTLSVTIENQHDMEAGDNTTASKDPINLLVPDHPVEFEDEITYDDDDCEPDLRTPVETEFQADSRKESSIKRTWQDSEGGDGDAINTNGDAKRVRS